jgi:iron complex outermembrane receptor protein
MMIACGVLVLLAASLLEASETAQIRGVVLSAGGDPVEGAVVALPELRLETATDASGEFVFDNIAPGEYLVSVTSMRFGGAVARVSTTEDPDAELELQLDKLVHSGAISVTAAGVARSLSELTTPVDLLEGEDLQLRKQSTLGDTLAQQPGVTATTYGQGSSRPVIRGLGEDRIRILENGLDTGDVSSIGPDHAVSMDPLAAEKVEVVRGPATVLWGANAIGGVVNVLDGRVPDRPASEPVTGAVELEYGSNASKKAGAVKLDGGTGNWAWHANLYARDQDDYSSPAPRPVEEEEHGHDEHEGEEDDDHHDEEEEFETGTVENSFTNAEGATVGLSYVADRGFIGLAVGGYNTEFGIPGHHHHHEEEDDDHEHDNDILRMTLDDDDDHDDHHEEEAGVKAQLEQRRVDLHSQLDDPFGGFSALRFSAGWRDYQHDEIEGDELGTRFENDWTEARLDLVNRKLLGFEGSLGLQYVNRDFSAFGEEAYVQPTDTTRFGAYIFEQTPLDPVRFQFGLRFDNQDTKSSDPMLPDRDFQTWTGSVGVVWQFHESWNLGANLNRPERAPTAEELYSDGPHAATFAYEIGDPNLDSEVGKGFEGILRATYERFEASLSVFANRYDGFIYLAETGEEIEGFEVLQFTQDDAEFKGFELHGHFEILHRAQSHLHLGFSYDQVKAELRDTGDPLPRIPPRRGRLALVYLAERWDARVEGWWVDDQTEVAEHETPTPGYEMLNASVGYKIFADTVVHELLLRGRNLTDEAAYNHVSFIKFQAPLPGRDISLVYRLLF